MKTWLLFFIILLLASCGPPLPEEGPSPYGHYSYADVNYFWEIGLCVEFSNCDSPKVHKWTSNILIQKFGNWTTREAEELNNIITELSQLTGLSITQTTGSANINIHIVTQDQFKSYCKLYNPNNPQEGFFELSTVSGVITSGTICIDINATEQTKLHLLREELTQSLGIGQDSGRYVNSIFQQNPNYQPMQYAEIDKKVIQLLYDYRVKPGMTQQEMDQALRSSSFGTQVASTVETNSKGG